MLKLIIYKELKEIIGSAKFAVTFGLCSILIILAFFTGIKNYETSMLEYNASNAARATRHEKRTDWSEVTDYQIFLTPKPLSSLVMGVSNDLGRSGYINGSDIPSFSDSTYSQQPVFAVFRFLDLEFVFQIILSLFAILFAFDSINGEKERGTLRLSFANSLPRANYILGKLAGSFLALALPLLIPILIGILMLPLSGITLSGEEWVRLFLFIAGGFLYLGVFLTLSVFISGLTQRPSSSFLFLLVIWVCSALIIPRASILVAGNIVEVPSSEEISMRQLQLGRQNAREYTEKLGELYKEFFQELRQGKDRSPEFQKKRQDEIGEALRKFRTEKDKQVKDLTSRLNEERRNLLNKQERLAFNISRISPVAVFNLASTTLAGTSVDLRNHFQKRAEEYSESFAAFYKKKTGREIGSPGSSSSRDEEEKKPKQPIDIREIPEFVYQPPGLSVILKDSIPDMAILILFNLIFFSGAFLAFLRYDLR